MSREGLREALSELIYAAELGIKVLPETLGSSLLVEAVRGAKDALKTDGKQATAEAMS